MLARIPWLLRLAGYIGFFVFAFVLFAYWTFPYERVANHYLQKAAAQKGFRVNVGTVDPYWLTGVEVENLHFYADAEDTIGVRIIDGHARAGILALLGSGTDLSFSFDLGNGGLEGSYAQDDDSLALRAELENVQLRMIPMLADAVGLPLAGAATGDIDLHLENEPDQSKGHVDLVVKKLRVGDGATKLSIPGVPAFTVDTIEAGDLKLSLDIADGRATLDELEARGEDVELQGSGDMRLGKTLSTSKPSISLRARFTDAYKTKTPRTEAMFSLMESSNSAQLKRAMTDDGWLAFSMTGSLSRPRFVPGAAAPPAPSR